MHDLTGFQRDVLYAIAGLENPKGLSIKDELDEYYGSEINHGRLYPNLDAGREGTGGQRKDRRPDEPILTDEPSTSGGRGASGVGRGVR